MTTPTARRADRSQPRTFERFAPPLFALLVVVVLALGGFLAFKDFLLRPAVAPGSVSVQSSMAGFTPSDIRVTAGSVATLDWWTQDAAIHLQDGVHTMIAPELGIYETLPAEGRRTVTWQVPDRPGTFDVYCDTCCGGKESPSMHGRIVIEPAA
ncbi:MAG TPA: cupredoxin domain-containing protein [Candidatus Limnocylindrales bacterium]|nr:cupredoxin domain-containing protein [Candidatus Limnocylindrales bacterium]